MADNLMSVGDVGATNARYALASTETGTYRDEQVLPCESFDSCEALFSSTSLMLVLLMSGGSVSPLQVLLWMAK